MKITVIFTIISCLFSTLWAEQGDYMTIAEARTIAEDYYGTFCKIAQNPNGDIAVLGQMKIQDLIGKDRNGHEMYSVFCLPDDIALLDGTHSNKNVTIGNYINLFRKYAESQKSKFSFRYKVIDVDYILPPSVYKGDRDPQFARVIINKSFVISPLQSVELTDTMFLNTHLRCITRISNKYRDATNPANDPEELMAMADAKCREKKYDEAFALYERVLQISPSNGDAIYSLGAMLWRGWGCKHKYSIAERKRMYNGYFKRLGVLGEKALNYINDGRTN